MYYRKNKWIYFNKIYKYLLTTLTYLFKSNVRIQTPDNLIRSLSYHVQFPQTNKKHTRKLD